MYRLENVTKSPNWSRPQQRFYKFFRSGVPCYPDDNSPDPFTLEEYRLYEQQRFEEFGGPIPVMDLGDVKHYSYTELKEMTEDFSEKYVVAENKFGRLFQIGKERNPEMQEITIKTWDLFYPFAPAYRGHLARFHDEIVLLRKEETKAHNNLVKLIGFCCDDKLAVIYNNLKVWKTVNDALADDHFTIDARLKVAIQMAELLKWFHDKLIVLGDIDASTIMIDEEFNMKLFDFERHASIPDKFSDVPVEFMPQYSTYLFGCALGRVSIKTDIRAFGILLYELITKRRIWMALDDDCREEIMEGRVSFVHKSLNCCYDVGCRLSDLVETCATMPDESQPHDGMEPIISRLKEIAHDLISSN